MLEVKESDHGTLYYRKAEVDELIAAKDEEIERLSAVLQTILDRDEDDHK